MSAQERDEDPVVLLTRPRAASDRFAGLIEDRFGARPSVVVSPIIDIVPTGNVPNLGGYATLIFTSGHAVEETARAAGLIGRACATVGRRTAALAQAAGASATCLGSNVDAFLAAARQGVLTPPCIHIRGMHTRGELAERLNGIGVPTDEAVVYDQRHLPLSRAALAVLSGPAPVILPLFSPRSAALLNIPEVSGPLDVVAISEAVAAAWTGPGGVSVAMDMTAEAMADLVATRLHTHSVGGSPPTH